MLRARLCGLVACAVLGVASAGAASAADSSSVDSARATSSSPASSLAWRSCGWGTCTDYMTRWETRNAWSRLQARRDIINSIMAGVCVGASGLTAAAAIAAGIGGPIGAAIVAGAAALAGLGCHAVTVKLGSQLRTLKAAAETGGCYAITFARYGSNNPLFATGWRVVYGSWCRP